MGRLGFFWSATLREFLLHFTYFSLEFYIEYCDYLINIGLSPPQ